MSFQRFRADWHDYTARCIYFITINKNPAIEDFGQLSGDIRIPVGQWGSPHLRPSKVGAAIKQVLMAFNRVEPKARILQYALMPDHLHFLIFIQEPTEEILGRIIARFKVAVDRAAGVDKAFSKGFNDQILKPARSLDVIFNYIRQNPYRLAVRRAYPDFFRRVNDLRIGDRAYQAYGNLQLLDNPFKEQVVVHRADTPDELARKRELWLYTAANGGVLVSPFISKAEKAVRAEAEELEGRAILIQNEAFPERYKPSARDFDLCEQGRLLIISVPGPMSRPHCLEMNSLAQRLCEDEHLFCPCGAVNWD